MSPLVRDVNTANSNVSADISSIAKGNPRLASSKNDSNCDCSSNGESEAEELDSLLREAASMFSDYVRDSKQNNSSIISDISPEELVNQLDLSIPQEKGLGKHGIWKDIQAICSSATNTWNDRFLYKLYASTTPIGVVSEALLGLLNNNAHVYKSSPIGTIIEARLSTRLAELANFPAATSAGLTFPGGSYSNMHALMVARNHRFPDIKTKGFVALNGARPLVFTSTHAHYSIEKAAIAAGIGLDNVIYVPTDDNGRMNTDALRSSIVDAIQRGDCPFFVNATAGTTVLGAFDPVDEMAAICEEFDLWLHLDGSWGSPLALFADDKEIFEYNVPYGKVNSFTINPHKLLGIPLQCSFLIMRDGIGIMKETLGLEANYLFHQPSPQSSDGDGAGSLKDRLGGSWDVGDATMGCGRRPDAIKFWVCWRYYGTQYFKQRVTRARQLSIMLADMVSTRESSFGRWKLFNEPQSTCVCFWFIPNFLAELEGNEEVYNGKLDRVTKDIADFINSTGAALIDFASVELFKDRTRFVVPSFFRVPLNNPNVTKETLQFVLDCIEDSASKLYSSDHMTGP